MDASVVLQVDAGNTTVKWRLLKGGAIVCFGRERHSDAFDVLVKVCERESVFRVHVSSVAGDVFDAQLAENLLRFNKQMTVDFARVEPCSGGVSCGYSDLSQLGIDRWMAVVAAAKKAEGAVLIADVGSAMTLDFVDRNKHHRGGYIVPGWPLMHGALIQGTKISPSNVPLEYQLESICPGKATMDCIGAGRILVLAGAIELAHKNFMEQEKGGVSVICTGGDAERIRPHLSMETIFCADLVFDGLSVAMGEQ